MSNARVAQVFQTTVFVLHNHHPLRSVLGCDQGRDFAKALAIIIARAIVFQSIPVCNRLDMHSYM